MKRFFVAFFIALFVLINPIAFIFAYNAPELKARTNLSSDIVPLGEAVDPQTGKTVKGYSITLYEQGNLSTIQGEGTLFNDFSTGPDSCFTVYAPGTRWKNSENWLINTTNNSGLTASYLLSNLTTDIAKWEDAADGVRGQNAIAIMGEGSITNEVLSVDTGAPDGRNEVYFGEIQNGGSTLARTNIWGFFDSFPLDQREIVEWDMIFDDRYSWSRNVLTNSYDFESIATHELGHAIGLNHPQNASCVENTMWGTFLTQDVSRRSLEAADISGAEFLYSNNTFADSDNDGVINNLDNCSNLANPFQENINREPMTYPIPFVYDDITNVIGDNVGDLCDGDMDHDYLLNSEEAGLGLDLKKADFDGDGILDGAEVRCGSDPKNPLSTVINPSADGVTKLADNDHEGLPDSCEAQFGTNPNAPDSDGDGALDSWEVLYRASSPLNVDSDSDGCSDMIEIVNINADKTVTSIDLGQVSQRFNARRGDTNFVANFDMNGDGWITSIDLSIIAQRFGQSCS